MRRKAPRVAVAFRRPAGAGLYLHAGRHAPGRLFSSSGGCMAARLRCGPGQNVCAAARPCSLSGGAACCAWYPPSWFKNECCRTAARLPDHRGGRGLPARRTVPDDRMLPCKGPLRQAGKGISRAKGCRPANAPAARGPACSAGIGRGRRLPPPAHLPEVRRVCARGAYGPGPCAQWVAKWLAYACFSAAATSMFSDAYAPSSASFENRSSTNSFGSGVVNLLTAKNTMAERIAPATNGGQPRM